MIRSAISTPNGLASIDGELHGDAVWIDLTEPTAAERTAVEKALAITLPSRVHMRAIEPSSRLVVGNDALTMTFTGLARNPSDPGVPVTCILKQGQLVTIRLAEAQPFDTARDNVAGDVGLEAHDVFVMLVEETIDEISDRLTSLGGEIDRITARVFSPDTKARRSRRRVQRTMTELGRAGTQIMRLQDSLTSLQRLKAFMEQHADRVAPQMDDRTAISAIGADVHALSELAEALDDKIDFLLDAMLGLIALDQNQIMMVLSLTAAMFLPATLISSIFGMNFTQMPGLTWHHGFFISLGVMAFASIAIGLIFRWRRWI